MTRMTIDSTPLHSTSDAEDTGNAWDSLSRLTRREGGSLLVLSVIPDVVEKAVAVIMDPENLDTPTASSDTANATLAAIQLIADLTSEDDPSPTQAVLEAGFLGLSREMNELFEGASDKYKRKMQDSLFLALSNVSSGNTEQKRALLDDAVVWETIEQGLEAAKPSIVFSALVTIQELLENSNLLKISEPEKPEIRSVADFFINKEGLIDKVRRCRVNGTGQQDVEAADKIFHAIQLGASPGTKVPDAVTSLP